MPTSSSRGHKIGAPKATIDRLRERNEKLHQEALARGSMHALATERRRSRAVARTVDAAAAGSLAPPPVEDAKPPRGRARPAASVDVPTGQPSALRVLWDEGIEGLVRRSRSRS